MTNSDGKSGNDSSSKGGETEGSKEGQGTLRDILAGYDQNKASGADSGAGDGDQTVTLSKEEYEDFRAMREDRVENRVEQAAGEITTALMQGRDDLDEDAVRGWLDRQSRENPDINNLVAMRFSNRTQFNEAVKALKSQFDEEKPAKTADKGEGDGKTESKNKQSAVRGARETSGETKSGSDDDLSDLSDQDFLVQSQKILRQAEAGQLK